MKILLIGLGSIGTRHLRNVLGLGYPDVSIVSRSGKVPVEFTGLNVYASLEKALEFDKYDVAIICTPTALHIQTLKTLENSGIPKIYLEKPVGHSLQEVEDFIGSRTSNSKVIVGYDLHFDPGFQKVNELLTVNAIGNLISVNAFVGQYLPDWRPAEDYRKGMSARKETGGGVLLDLIHEFDYLFSFCGQAKTIAAQYKSSGVLEIETEDVADVLIQFENGCSGTIHLDYLQQRLIRNCVLTGQFGTIIWNLAERNVSWIDINKNESHFNYDHFERNDRFVAIMQAFLEDETDSRLTSFSDGIESLKMVEAAKRSSETMQFVFMENFKSSLQ